MGRPPLTIFAQIDRPYNFVADSIHRKKFCSRLWELFFKWSAILH